MNLNINYNQITPLCEIMTRNRSDKGNTNLNYAWHHYTMFYYELFKNIKDNKLRVFELGMGTTDPNIDSNMGPNGRPGASLFGWSEFFPNSQIFGADIDKKILFETDRIKTYYCDQTDAECIKTMWSHPELSENFDIIIDDGLHRYYSNECFFENSIHKLKLNGYYVIEDINNKRDLPYLLEIVDKWKIKYNNYNFELIKFPSHWNDYDNNIMLITRKQELKELKENIKSDILDNSIIINYSTFNYEKITNLHLETLKKIFTKEENIKHKIDNLYSNYEFKNDGFQTDIWYYAINNKINHLINILEEFKNSNLITYFIFTDCDIVFIEKNKHEWKNLQNFIDNNENDIFFMREYEYDSVNTGFFIIKNNKNLKYLINFFKNVLFNLIYRDKKTLTLADQSVVNEMMPYMNFDYIPSEYVVYSGIKFNPDKALLYHAISCDTKEQKLSLLNELLNLFK